MNQAINQNRLRKAVIYQINLRIFTPEGTFRAAETRLTHLRDLGVDVLYLCPFVRADEDADKSGWSHRMLVSGANNPKNPYRIADYFAVDSEYGTDADVESFVKTAHNFGMKVMFDLVYMHCGPNAVFFADHPDFVCHNPDGSVKTTDYHFPYLNFDSPELREYLWDNMTYFVRRFDVDGYRCDCGDEVPLDFWIEGTKRVRAVKPDFIMLNEGRKGEAVETCFDSNYGGDWFYVQAGVFAKRMAVEDFRKRWTLDRDKLPKNGLWLRGYENHDVANDAFDCRPDRVYGTAAGEAALAVNFTLDGVPFLYNGNEFGDSKRHNFLANRFTLSDIGIDWSQLTTESGKDRLEKVRRFIALRHASDALCFGETVWSEEKKPSVIAFRRVGKTETYFTLANLTDVSVMTDVNEDFGTFETVFSSGAKKSAEGVSLEPFGYWILKKENDGNAFE